MAQGHRPDTQHQAHSLTTSWPSLRYLGCQGKEPTYQGCHRLLETWCQSALGELPGLAPSGVGDSWEESLVRVHLGW